VWKGDQEVIPKPKPGDRSGPLEAPFNDTDFSASYPTLAAYLTDVRYQDNTPRTTSTVLIFCEQGVLRLCVNDRDNNRSVFFTGETIEAALLSAENAIATNTAEWKSRQGYTRNAPQTPF